MTENKRRDMNRMWNIRNPYQGNRKKVLCVCSAGLLRSPTAAIVLSQSPFNCNTRAAGTANDHALISVDNVMIEWADIIICMQEQHKEKLCDIINTEFEDDKNKEKIYVLDIKDCYEFMEPELQEIIKEKCSVIIL